MRSSNHKLPLPKKPRGMSDAAYQANVALLRRVNGFVEPRSTAMGYAVQNRAGTPTTSAELVAFAAAIEVYLPTGKGTRRMR